MDTDALERFMAKAVVADTGCWLWTAYTNASGYGIFGGQRSTLAHRSAYEHFIGPIPDGLQIDHLCRNRGCVNPAHLEPVTQQENIRRGNAPAARNARRTHCRNGHPLYGPNVRIEKGGRRRCVPCQAAYDHRKNANR